MKKLLALVMSLCLLCACCAYAEETVEINWSDVEEQASAIEGQFAPIADLGVMMFIPAVFGSAEVTEEQKAAGVIALLTTADGAGRVSFTYQDLGEMDSEAYTAELIKAGADPDRQLRSHGRRRVRCCGSDHGLFPPERSVITETSVYPAGCTVYRGASCFHCKGRVKPV